SRKSRSALGSVSAYESSDASAAGCSAGACATLGTGAGAGGVAVTSAGGGAPVSANALSGARASAAARPTESAVARRATTAALGTNGIHGIMCPLLDGRQQRDGRRALRGTTGQTLFRCG